ncbi:hypothetical protein ISN45_At03g045970 [Arabidopsis thaliana x Arabidopsis arenosa]|uniref:Uncharacterized protein n=3 Tax=Arabidopsis TaxID=3701 RepID=Q3EAK6_ARATH|nr:uncharacterized protein AT3G53235 [Arabidopsis thaliana]AEE79053.1 hypothetical protein AT3G53235 [Arabidopsis thaliana]KAG7628327.1 hypothetical protein ISN45_At03g045970 [Arabidopsis thaliana x Arabidopsis arenosa]KAG7634241.1 hypothetical protein ISN44_As03g044920 [Arabidopsis suecica]|eukprot:NP_680126.1 hypothetical protein AT3G53235 [Arabidopsis thaliana]
MVVMSSLTVEGGGRGIYTKDQRLHHVQKDRSAIPSTRGVDNHHNIPRQNFDNWGANGGGGGGGGEDGTADIKPMFSAFVMSLIVESMSSQPILPIRIASPPKEKTAEESSVVTS